VIPPGADCVLDAGGLERAEGALAEAIHARHVEDSFALVGIHTRGAVLAARLARRLAAAGRAPACGSIDISLYRDDLTRRRALPVIQSTDLPFAVEGARLILVDDVLYTGRTIRAALEELQDHGRPARIELAVLVDRGNRELPIAADFVALTLPTAPEDHVRVCFPESDGGLAGVYHLAGDRAGDATR
jgi:pyrimidine operon attenuation protein/uracil phosphoribosyltransferase